MEARMGVVTDRGACEIPISAEGDIVLVRKKIREIAIEFGFSSTDVTRIVTATSELARNIYKYAGEGTVRYGMLQQVSQLGLELCFSDSGPGIDDISLALEPGYSTSNSLGMGLPGAQRLMDSFDVDSHPGRGVVIKVVKWRK
jgi:serine/threonine-protein kinase RsbT